MSNYKLTISQGLGFKSIDLTEDDMKDWDNLIIQLNSKVGDLSKSELINSKNLTDYILNSFIELGVSVKLHKTNNEILTDNSLFITDSIDTSIYPLDESSSFMNSIKEYLSRKLVGNEILTEIIESMESLELNLGKEVTDYVIHLMELLGYKVEFYLNYNNE